MKVRLLVVFLVIILFVGCKNKEKYDFSDVEIEATTETTQNNIQDGIILMQKREN